MSVAVRDRGLGVPLVVALAGVVVVAALVGLRAAGHTNFATDPVGAVALVGAAVVASSAGARLSASGTVRAATYARWLAASVLVYLASAVLAVGSSGADHGAAAAAVAIWSTAWLPPLALGQLTASSAIREGAPGRPWSHRLLIATVGVAAVTNMLLVAPSAPFDGVPTIAPESWHTRLAPLGLVVTTVTALAFLMLPALLWRAALTSDGAARARLGVAAAGASAAPLTITFCLLLAAARNPGDVEPALGSVTFLVAIAASTAVSAVCSVLASRDAVEPHRLKVVVRGTGLAVAALVVVALGTMLAAPGVGLGPTTTAVLIATSTVIVVGAAWFGTGLLTRVLLPAVGLVAATPVRVPGLTPRESEVLGLVAEGASNAGIAEQLVVSKRTVDAHLRAIFTKLDLGTTGPETNRRVQATRIWLDVARSQEIGGTADADR